MRSSKWFFTGIFLIGVFVFAGSIQPAAAQDQLTPGTPVQGTLSSDTVTYTLNAGGGQLITLSVESTDFDPQVTLTEASGVELASDDDGGEGTNALLAYMPQSEGVFTVIVSSWGGTGAFTLTPDTVVPPNLEMGQTAALPVNGQSTLYATFTGTANSTVNIYTTSPDDNDLYLSLHGVDGQEIAADDDSGPGVTPYLRRVSLPEDGLYLVEIRSVFGDPMTPPVDVTVEAAERLYLTTTPQQVTLGDATLSFEVFSLEVSAGTMYRIVVSSDNGNGVQLEIAESGSDYNPSLSVDAAYRVAWDYRAETSGLIHLTLHAGFFMDEATYSIWFEAVD